MTSKNKGIKSKKRAKQHLTAINSELKNLYKNLETLAKKYNELQGSSAENCNWNGVLAKRYYKGAKQNFDNIVKNYNKGLEEAKELADKADKTSNGDK